jgi:hypothetical protein
MMHNDDMAKEAILTVRVPAATKQALDARARKNRRSLSAQIATYLDQGLEQEPSGPTRAGGRFLGMYEGARVPTDRESAEVRAFLRDSLHARLARFK